MSATFRWPWPMSTRGSIAANGSALGRAVAFAAIPVCTRRHDRDARVPADRGRRARGCGGLGAWIVTVARMRGMDMGPGTDLGGIGFFLGIWVTMMAAMMLPSAVPMVLLF